MQRLNLSKTQREKVGYLRDCMETLACQRYWRELKTYPISNCDTNIYRNRNVKLGLVYEQEARIVSYGTCHSAMKTSSKKCLAVVNICNYNRINSDDYGYPYNVSEKEWRPNIIRYLDFIFNRSPWAPVFETKDPEEAIDRTYVANTHHDANYTVGALIAARSATERYRTVCKNWCDLVDKGYEERAAILLASNYNLNSDKVLNLESNRDHIAFSSAINKEGIKKFLNYDINSPHVPVSKSYYERGTYSAITCFWEDQDYFYHRYHSLKGPLDNIVSDSIRFANENGKPINNVKFPDIFNKSMQIYKKNKAIGTYVVPATKNTNAFFEEGIKQIEACA